MLIGKIQTLTLLTHQVSLSTIYSLTSGCIFSILFFIHFLRYFSELVIAFVTEYPTVIIKDLQFELSSKTDEHVHVVMMFMC